MESPETEIKQGREAKHQKVKEMNDVKFEKPLRKKGNEREEQVLFRASSTDKKQLKELAQKFDTSMSHVLRVAIGAMHKQMIQEQPKKSNK